MTAQSTLRGPLLTYQRHRERIEDILVATGLSFLVGLFLNATHVYPQEWQLVLLLTIFVVGTQAREWAYYVAIATVLWPLWFISPYLMALFVAVALLPRTLIIEHLPWILLVLSAPLLAEWHALALPPLLAALIAGASIGFWVGALTAFWIKLVAGLSGWIPELAALHGQAFTLTPIETLVRDASSLETLELLAAPFIQSSSMLLLHVLQIVAWGCAGWLVGKIIQVDWQQVSPHIAIIPSLSAGLILLWSAIYLLPAWLELQPLSYVLSHPLPMAGLLLSALTAGCLASLYEEIQRPVSPRLIRASGQARQQKHKPQQTSNTQPSPSWSNTPSNKEKLILLEFD